MPDGSSSQGNPTPRRSLPVRVMRRLRHPSTRRRLAYSGADLRYALYHLVVNVVGGSPLLPRVFRPAVYKLGGIDASGANLYPHIRFLGMGPVSFGEGTTFNGDVVIDNKAPISFGRNVNVGPGTSFLTSTHDLSGPTKRAGPTRFDPLRIGDGVWIGAGAVLLPGVSVGDGAVVAAGAVVTSDLQANGLYGGIPARLIRELDDDSPST